jgi:hypothetical protein
VVMQVYRFLCHVKIMIKKLLLITSLIISGSLWADMDKVCRVEANFIGIKEEAFIFYNCERNNILMVVDIFASEVPKVISQFCRYDRNVHEHMTNDSRPTLTCVLYERYPRGFILPK